MPDFKCVECRTRVRHIGDTSSGAGDPCPGCGAPLEPVGELTEVIGFRSLTTADRLVDSEALVGDLATRRDARYAQLRGDAFDDERWIDDGGSAVAAVALPTSDRRSRRGAPGENGTP